MADTLILETSFLIDFEREANAKRRAVSRRATERRASSQRSAGPAHEFLKAHLDARLCITMTTVGELAVGTESRATLDAFIAPFSVLGIDPDVCWEYSRAYRYLARHGLLIGSNDLWIAATAVAHDAPLVTGDAQHFARVPNLRTLEYR